MSWRGSIKRDKTDILFSWLVRERADWICEHCRLELRESPGRLHCSHVYTRGKKSIRYHPLNAFAHCLNCHDYLGKNPLVFAEWVKGRLSDQDYERLKYLASRPTRFTKWDKEMIHSHYKEEKQRLQRLRREGARGRLEFHLP